MRLNLISASLFAVLLTTACHGSRVGHGPPVVIHEGHAHTAHCGHFRMGKKRHMNHGHVHREGCGHHFRGGVWIRL